MNNYPQVKNEVNRKKAVVNKKVYGLFTFQNSIGNWSIIDVEKIKNHYTVLYMHESELKGNFLNSVHGNYYRIRSGILTSIKTDKNKVLSNKKNFIKAFVDKTGKDIDINRTLETI